MYAIKKTLMNRHYEGRGVPNVDSPARSLVALLIAITLSYPLCGMADESQGAVSETETQTRPPLKNSKGIYYPEAAKRAGLEGKALVAFDIVADGRVANLSIISSDDSAFERTRM